MAKKKKSKNIKKTSSKKQNVSVSKIDDAVEEIISSEQPATRRKVSPILWFCLWCIVLFFAYTKMGLFGQSLNNVFTIAFGSLYYAGGAILLAWFILFRLCKINNPLMLWGCILLSFAIWLLYCYQLNECSDFQGFVIYSNTFFHQPVSTEIGKTGGVIPYLIYCLAVVCLSRQGCMILICILFALAALLIITINGFKSFFALAHKTIVTSAGNVNRFIEDSEKEIEKQIEEKEERKRQIIAVQMAEEKKRKKEELRKEVLSNSPTFINLTDEEIGIQEDDVLSPVQANEDADVSQESNDNNKPVVRRRKTNGKYRLPRPLSYFLDDYSSSQSTVNKEAADIKGKKVIDILKTFDIHAELIKTYIGPSVTKFEIKPDSSVKINKILNLQDNIKMELAAKEIRIEAPVPGKSAVGIEIPNQEMVPVRLYEIAKNIPANYKDKPLIIFLGKDLSGKPVYADLTKNLGTLICGQTGSGKSVCVGSVICSFLLSMRPDELKLVLIDPKKVEFTMYNDIPHLLFPIINDASEATFALKKITVIMDERYELLAEAGVRNIDGYNAYVDDYNNNLKEGEEPLSKMPYLVCIVDELADLMMIAGKDVEMSIQRITQLARAAGIFLILATQRPSTDVITGLIKANMPSRIAFATSSSIDSRTILDQVGAEKLLGKGDMLYYPQGESAPIRVQGVYVSDDEIKRITDYVKSQGEPEYDDSYYAFINNCRGGGSERGGMSAAENDSLYNDVVEFVKEQQKASTSLLQRRFGIGYNRAARLIDTLEENGVIGASNGAKPREVYLKPED